MKLPADKIKNGLLLTFVFSLPFENWDPLGIASFFSITKMAGFGYFFFSILKLKDSFSLNHVVYPVIILLLIWIWLVFQSLINIWSGSNLSFHYFTLLQSIMLFWLVFNDIYKNPQLLRRCLLTLVLGVYLMSFLALFLGIGLSKEMDSNLGEFRITFFGANPNVIGNFCSISLLIAISMVINRNKYYGKKTLLLVLTLPTFLAMISFSGSRGALGGVLLGLLVLFLFQKISIRKRIIILFFGIVFFIYALDQILGSSVMQERILQTTEEGSLGVREHIWTNALEIFYDNPFFGLGNTGYELEMLQRTGTYRDTHNLFLYFMVTGGVIAVSLYFLFLKFVFKSALYFFKYQKDGLMLTLFMVYLFIVFKSGGVLNDKLMWFLVALIFSSRYTRQNLSLKYK